MKRWFWNVFDVTLFSVIAASFFFHTPARVNAAVAVEPTDPAIDYNSTDWKIVARNTNTGAALSYDAGHIVTVAPGVKSVNILMRSGSALYFGNDRNMPYDVIIVQERFDCETIKVSDRVTQFYYQGKLIKEEPINSKYHAPRGSDVIIGPLVCGDYTPRSEI